jgi:hypothetical protein
MQDLDGQQGCARPPVRPLSTPSAKQMVMNRPDTRRWKAARVMDDRTKC